MDDFWGHFWSAVQALGAVAAIGWAICLWRRDRQMAKDRQDAKARVLAFRLMPILYDIWSAADMAKKALDHLEPFLSTRDYSGILLGLDKGVRMPPPPPENLFDDFDCLAPDLARALAHLFYSAERSNRYIKDLLEVTEKEPAEIVPKIFPNYRDRLKSIRSDYSLCVALC